VLPHQNSNSLLAKGDNINNFENKSIEFGKGEADANNYDYNLNLHFNIDKSISTSKLNMLLANNNNNNNNNNSNSDNSNISSVSPDQRKRKKESNYTNNNLNLNKFINNPSSKNLNNNNNSNTQNVHQAFIPTLDDIMAEGNQQNEKSVKNENTAFNNIKNFEKSYEPISVASQNQKFPSDNNSIYSHKFLSVSKNLSK